MLFLIAAVSSLLAIALHNFYWKRRKLPPGPTPLPLVGNILTLIRKKPGEDAFLQWRRQYGPVYTYWLGELAVVCVADYDSIVEVFQRGGDEFLGRYQFVDFTVAYRGGPYGIFFTEGYFWKEQRKFANHVFRHFGLSSNILEERILGELGIMFGRIDKQLDGNGEHSDFDLVKDIEVSVGSIINGILFGYGYDTEERIAEFGELLGLYQSGFSVAYEKRLGSLFSTLILCFPNTFKDLPLFKDRYDSLMATSRGLRNFFERRIRDRMEIIDYENAGSGDYVEAYLKEKARKDATQDEGHSFSWAANIFQKFVVVLTRRMDQLWNMCMDLWIAGQETTSTTLAWGIAHLLRSGDAMGKLCAELERVVGDGRTVTMADRPSLPYTNAVVNEFLRISNMIVQNCYRRVLADVTVGGHRLRKGTCILPQVSAVLIDDQVFASPKAFSPDRFLDANNNLLKCEQLIPFSVGKRKCFAEAMARMELFLFTANIFNRYRLSVAKEPPSVSREMGITIHCPHFRCAIRKRSTRENKDMVQLRDFASFMQPTD